MQNTLKNEQRWGHYLLLLLGILCISWSAVLVKIANVGGPASAFYRMFFGTLGVIPVWMYFRKPLNSLRGVKVAIICGVLFAFDIALWNSSIVLSKASVSTLLANLAPVWVGLGSLFFLKEKPTKLFWIGTVTSIVGVIFIIGVNQIFQASLNLGNGLAILASMFYGAYIITVKKGRNTLDTFTFTMISMSVSTVVLGLICLISSTSLWGFEEKSWIALLLLGLVPQLIGWLAINQALGHIRPTVASVSLLSQSVFTALFSIPVLGEILTINEMFGAIIVLGGIYLVNKK